jgi:hypothetical protein
MALVLVHDDAFGDDVDLDRVDAGYVLPLRDICPQLAGLERGVTCLGSGQYVAVSLG